VWYETVCTTVPYLCYLLRSLQQGQVNVWHNMWQSAPLPHAQPTGQLHIALHHRQVWVLWVADCEEAAVQVHLIDNRHCNFWSLLQLTATLHRYLTSLAGRFTIHLNTAMFVLTTMRTSNPTTIHLLESVMWECQQINLKLKSNLKTDKKMS
jgi:hypothetical protein